MQVLAGDRPLAGKLTQLLGTLGGAAPHVTQSPGPEPDSSGLKHVWLSLAPASDALGASTQRGVLSALKCTRRCLGQ